VRNTLTNVETNKKSSALENLGVNVIKSYLNDLTTSAGVYRMLDLEGQVLYVGKAKNLKNRVSNYARLTGHSARINRMINSTSSMMFLTTDTEIEALLLEQNLIKQLKPKFNVLLRDDKSFPDIAISMAHPFPQVIKSRGRRLPGNKYFGPFASARAVNQTLSYLQKIFLLRNCSDTIYESRTRPCLQYQIKRCSGPCVGKISQNDYKKSINDAEMFLAGKTSEIKKTLAIEMTNASSELNFEKAGVLRDRIQSLTHIQGSQGINPTIVSDADLIAMATEGSQVCIQIFFFRSNQNWGNKAYFPQTGVGADAGEILEAFIMQFYRERLPPSLILVSHDVENKNLVADALKENHKKSVKIETPSKGEKIKLLFSAMRNASEELARKIASFENQTKLLISIKTKFNLVEMPQRIEVYDNSHFQGSNAVGAMIVAGPEGFVRSQYRKFSIKDPSVTPGDDVHMMYHVLSRRFARLKNQNDTVFSTDYPDLILIDGGLAQVKSAARVLTEMALEEIPIIGVAKGLDRNAGKEELYFVNGTSIMLKHNDPILFFIQRLRDEAHRFVVGAHRKKRSKAFKVNQLDKISGIGATRKGALLSYFGSAKGVSVSSLNDLKKVEGISSALANTIYNHFNDFDR
jgi:excinuclease ABC subunit C